MNLSPATMSVKSWRPYVSVNKLWLELAMSERVPATYHKFVGSGRVLEQPKWWMNTNWPCPVSVKSGGPVCAAARVWVSHVRVVLQLLKFVHQR
jgi:hypothetical protein